MQALAITTDRGSLIEHTGYEPLRIQSSYLKKHSRVCFSNFVSFPKSRLLSRSSKPIVSVLVTASSSSASSLSSDDDDDDEDLDRDVLKNLNPAVRKRVEVLIEIENQYNELKAKFIEERSALEANYLKLYQPLFTKRYEIVNGPKGVSNFWLTVLKNNEITSKDITEQDEEALKYLKDIKWSILKGGFKLEFSFDQNNPYFKNTVLTKEYYTMDPYFNFYHSRTEGTRNIEWYPGKRLISELSTNYEDFVSFFNFFSPAQYGYWSLGNMKDTREDWRTGLTIKHQIISHAVSWFTGQNLALENLSPHVEVLREIQKQYDELEAKYLEESAALETKYNKLYQPLYTKRYEIVNGVVEVEGVISEQGEVQEKGVPNFWLTVLKSNAYATYDIYEQDKGALKYLKDIKWSRIEEEEAPNWWSMPEEPKWYKIEFFFDEKNPYFKNSVLTKRYYLIDGDIHYAFKKAIGTEIEWYPGNCLTTKPTRTEEEEEEEEKDFVSFFDFFSPLVSFFEFNRALAYKHEIVPLAVSLFLEPVPGEYSSHETDEDAYEDGDDYWEEIYSKSTPIRSEAAGV